MSCYKPSDSYYGIFVTSDDRGVATDADSTPTIYAIKNVAIDGLFAVTAAKIATGTYKATGTIPSTYVAGDVVSMQAAATVDGEAGKQVFDTFIVDTARNSDAVTLPAGTGVTLVSPVAADDSLTIYEGTDYDGANKLTWTVTDYSGYDLTSATAKFRLLKENQYNADTVEAVLEKALTTVSQADTTVTLEVELTSTNTSSLETCPPKDTYNYRYQIIATTSGSKVTPLVNGQCTVKKTLEAPSA